MAINDRLHTLLHLENFATLVYCLINTRNGDIQYIGCGAPPLALIADKKPPQMLNCNGVPLGLLPSSALSIELKQAKLSKNASMLFYSDALIETPHGKKGELWLDTGLEKALLQAQKGSKNLIDEILTSFYKNAATPLRDDLTLVSLKRL